MDKKTIRVSETNLRKCIKDASRQMLIDAIEAPNKLYECSPSDKTKYVRGSFLPREEKEMKTFLCSLVDICLTNV